jgi:hypothetical protein
MNGPEFFQDSIPIAALGQVVMVLLCGENRG